MSCFICFLLYFVEQIEEYVDNCLMWLLDDINDYCDIFDFLFILSCNVEFVIV